MQKMKMFLLRILLLAFLLQNKLAATSNEIAGEIIAQFLKGIGQADFRENPLSEIIGLEKAVLPEPIFPQRNEYPSLLFNEIELMRLRRKMMSAPYSEWFDEIFNTTLSIANEPSSPLLLERERSKIAKMNAFCYAITQQHHFLESALTAMNSIGEVEKPTTPEGGKVNFGWGDWMQAADALEMYAVAYDILYREFSQEEKNEINRKLSAMTNQMVKHFTKLPKNLSSLELSTGLGMPKNNHIINIAAGVAAISLVLDVPDAEDWFLSAYNELQSGLMMIYKDGSYKEGYYYGMFAAQKLFAFFVYYEQKTGINLFEAPRIKFFTRWLIDLLKENGTYPLFDDAFPQNFLVFPLAVGLSPLDEELRFIFERDEETYSRTDPHWIEVFCNYERFVSAQNPYQKSLTIYPDGGYSVFRGENECYGLFLNEPGRANLSGHDHVEPMAFTLSVFGEDFLIDAGYGPKGVNDVNRAWFINSQAHNIPLINGFGPNQNPIWGDALGSELIAAYQSEKVSFASAFANYRNTELKRHILLQDERFFVIIDEIMTEDKNRVTIPWHGLGNCSEKGFNKFQWRQNEANLELEYLTLNRTAQYTLKKGLNTYKNKEHSYANATFSMENDEEKIVSVIMPNSIENMISSFDYPILSSGKTKGKMFLNENSEQIGILVVAETSWQAESVESDAKVAFFRVDNQIEYITFFDATYVKIQNAYIVQSEKPISAHINPYGTYPEGYIINSKTYPVAISLYSQMKPSSLFLDGNFTDFDYQNERMLFSASGGGLLSCAPSVDDFYPPIHDSYPILSYLNHFEHGNDLRFLSYEKKTLLRNEILAISGKSVVSEIDSLFHIPHFSEKMYGIASGIFSNLWHANEQFKMSLPQQFDWSRKIGKWNFRYFERGILTEKGISAYEHRFYLHDFLFFSHENLFQEHTFTQLELQFSDKIIAGFYEQWEKKTSSELILSGTKNQRNWQLNYKDDNIRNYTKEAASWQSQNVSIQSEFLYLRNENVKQMNLDFDYRQAKNALQSDITITNEKEISKGNVHFQKQWNAYLSSFSQFSYQKENQADVTIRLNLYSQWKLLTQSLQNQYHEENNWNFTYSVKTSWKSWRFKGTFSKKEKWRNEVKAAYRIRNFQLENTLDSEKNHSVSGDYFISAKWSINSLVKMNYRDGEVMEHGYGIGYFGKFNVINHFSMFSRTDIFRYKIDNFVSFFILPKQMIQLLSELSLSQNGDICAYQIRLKQRSANYAPGILFSKDERGFTRYEGYVELFFY